MLVTRNVSRLIARLRRPGSERQFLRGEHGAIAVYFGLSAIVFVGVAGLAVDAARGYLVKARLSEAIDAAALAGGKALQTANDPDNNKVHADALAFFDANFPNGAMGANVVTPVINVINNDTQVTVSSSATIPTTLMRVLGFQQMTMAAAATVSRAQGGLDVVFSFDVSGSMDGQRITYLKSNATALVDSLFKPFTEGGQQQMVTVNGLQYSLLNIGVVPWASKVNVRTYPATTNGAITGPFGNSFTNPTGRRYPDNAANATLPGTYRAANSEVPLLLNPGNGTQMPGGWRGCVYARYTDNSNQNDDADTTLGTSATWPGWEPIATREGEPGFFSVCDTGFWNNNQNAPGWAGGAPKPTHGWPSTPTPTYYDTCDICPDIGILPLQTSAAPVNAMINALDARGGTVAAQGLFWAWEVLMPGAPFDQAKVNPPFLRAQAIVFMTDGLNEGTAGDAYHGWFGAGPPAGTTSAKGDLILPDGTNVDNNLNGHLAELAQKIKGTNPLDSSAVKIYVIQYVNNNAVLTALLKSVATQDIAPYYFYVDSPTNLGDVFDQIAESLTALRIVQ